MEETKDKYILLVDREGSKLERSFSALGPSMNATPTQVLRGELLEALPKAEQPSDFRRRALVGIDRKSLRLECGTADLSLLSDKEANLLLAISSLGERYRTFSTCGRLNFGRTLSPGHRVFASVKGSRHDLPGVVRYKGELPSRPGTMFGVELTENPGYGRCDGTHMSERYFTCPQHSGVFVGLDKLTPDSLQKREENAQANVKSRHMDTDVPSFLNRKSERKARSRSYLHRPSGNNPRSKEEQGENLQRQLTEMEQQLREKDQQKDNLQRQLRKMERQPRGKGEREENLQRRLREIQQELINLRRKCEEKEQGCSNLERELRDRDQDLVELNKTLSEAEKKLKECKCQEKRDWIIPRDEVVITDKRLGEGSWGYVNEGKYCGCTVAVKRFSGNEVISSYNRRKFEREMDIASRCRHPCLLQFVGATNDEGSPLFVTELMESSLRQLLKQRSLTDGEVLTVSLDVARALSYLHKKKPPILHRDVSSPNVLLWRRDNQWRAKVSDYGTANFQQETMTANPGAMIYSAPEACAPTQTIKIDVYSFGVLLCEMCIQEVPECDRRDEQVDLVKNPEIQALIRRCLQSEAEDRPNMEEIIVELEKLNETS